MKTHPLETLSLFALIWPLAVQAAQPLNDSALDQVHIPGGSVLNIAGTTSAGKGTLATTTPSKGELNTLNASLGAANQSTRDATEAGPNQRGRPLQSSPATPGVQVPTVVHVGLDGQTRIAADPAKSSITSRTTASGALQVETVNQITEVAVHNARDIANIPRGDYSFSNIQITNSVHIMSHP